MEVNLPGDVKNIILSYLVYKCCDCRTEVDHSLVKNCMNTHCHTMSWSDFGRSCNYGFLCDTCYVRAGQNNGLCDQCCWDEIT